jgi:hypothetical protein
MRLVSIDLLVEYNSFIGLINPLPPTVYAVSSVPFKLRFNSNTYATIEDPLFVSHSKALPYTYGVSTSPSSSWLSVTSSTRTLSGIPPTITSPQDLGVTLKASNPTISQYTAPGPFTLVIEPPTGTI